MNDIDVVRCERDHFRAKNAALRLENDRLSELLEYCETSDS